MAEVQNIPFFPKGYYPEVLTRSYLNDPLVKALYPNSGPDSDFQEQMAWRKEFPVAMRTTLADELRRQYGDMASGKVLENIESLRVEGTFTVTTGQQIHIMLGPMYVVYKALTTIWLAQDLKRQFPDYHFVPVFWMATEDHDFEEINHFRLFGKDFQWQTETGGPVGRLDTAGLAGVLAEVQERFSSDPSVAKALEVFVRAYSQFHNLADSTRFLLNHFFGEQGLVVIDPDSTAFKKAFASYMLRDLQDNEVELAIRERTEAMQQLGLETAIHGRSPNTFFLNHGKRERIDRVGDGFRLKQSGLDFQAAALENMLKDQPDRFSPNVALRPVYQEVLLPNLAYIAGPGEYTYWYQLHPVFAGFGMVAPILLARNSFVFSDAKTRDWLADKHWDIEQLFQPEEILKSLFISHLKDNNPLEQWGQSMGGTMEEIHAYLYKSHHPDLKIIKKSGEEYLKLLRGAVEKYNNSLIDNPLNAAEWSRLSKIKQRFFELTSPQERTLFFIEAYTQNWTLPQNLDNLSDYLKWPLSLVWR